MKRINIYLFIILFELCFLLISYKVFHLPITHDETSTTVHYSNFSCWQIMMYPDNWPNNHILNTLFTKLMIWIFGAEQWVVRLPNLFSFLVYAFAIFRINKTVLKTSSIFFIPASILFICNPYLLDFFGLCRGYAMSCALCTLSVSYMISGFIAFEKKHIWLAFFLAVLASYANFTLLVFWVAVIAITWLYFFVQFKTLKKKLIQPTILIILFSLAYAALIAVPIIKMQSTNQFQYWESTGFYKGTIVPLVIQSLYDPAGFSSIIYHAISIFTIVVVFGNLVYIMIKFVRSRFNPDYLQKPVFVASSILLLTAFVSILQCIILHTPNLYGRTALFFFPLFIITFVTTIGLISNQKAKIFQGVVSFLLSFLLLFQIADKMSLKYVREWWFNADTFEIIDYFNKTNPNQKISLKTNWLFHPSFYFYKYTGKIPYIDLKSIDHSIDINTDADYYYIMPGDYKTLEPEFEISYKVNDERWLLKRKALAQHYCVGNIEHVALLNRPSMTAPDSNYQRDSTGNSFFLLTDEFSPGFYRKYSEITSAKSIYLSATVKVFPLEVVDPKSLNVVISREHENKIFDYYLSGENQSPILKPHNWTTLTVSGIISGSDKNDLLKVYLWNPAKKKIMMDDFVIYYTKK